MRLADYCRPSPPPPLPPSCPLGSPAELQWLIQARLDRAGPFPTPPTPFPHTQLLSLAFIRFDTPHPPAIVRTRKGRMDLFVGTVLVVFACECGSEPPSNHKAVRPIMSAVRL
ncbi:hypothetical protein KUCAC02_011155 [Chaenocephalus aceratus]|uniref:Uncharacterized protein n=1 Tax=Chaenocephalus aceratus TaxID=36190 RepID=A0ACB9WWI1_CHAAC|nr:hypothetical protein KUCAC02_011155 [Chaenocephalus aceratus]